MNNDDLDEYTKTLAEVRKSRIEALEGAMRQRGWKRSVHLWFSGLFAKIEAMGKRWRDDDLENK